MGTHSARHGARERKDQQVTDIRMEELRPTEVWEEIPPAHSRSRSVYAARVRWMEEHPFRWVLWSFHSTTTSLPSGLRAQGFLARTAPTPDSTEERPYKRLYATFVGPANIKVAKDKFAIDPLWRPAEEEIEQIRQAALEGTLTPFARPAAIEPEVKKRTRRTFPPEFRAAAVKRVQAGESATKVGRDIGVVGSVIRGWVAAASTTKRRGTQKRTRQAA